MTKSIEDTIKKVEALYRSLTGSEPPTSNGAYSPVPPESDLLEHVEAQLSRLASLVTTPMPLARPTWIPAISVWEDDSGLVIDMELAGIDKSDLEIVRLQQVVTISGVRSPLARVRRLWLNDRRFGPFCRTVILPAYVDPTSMRTTSKLGVLQLHFERSSESQETKGMDHN